MNHDDNNPDIRPLIEPELEARVVAWVSGEASAFEVAELERLVAERPELAIFKRRIEAVRGLIGEAVRPDPQPLLLAPERRTKLLRDIGAPEALTAKVNQPMAASKRAHRKSMAWMYAVAACLVTGLFTILFMANFRSYKRPVSRPVMSSPAPHMESRFEVRPAPKPGEQDDRSQSVNLPVAATAEAATVSPNEVAVLERQRAASAESKFKDSLAKKEVRSRMQEEDRQRAVEAALDSEKRREAQVAQEIRRRRAMPELADEDRGPSAPAGPPPAPNSILYGAGAYSSSTTLAGNRLNTELRDVGSGITVITKQYLEDTKVTGAEQAQTYGDGTQAIGGARVGYYNQNAGTAGAPAADPAPHGLDLFNDRLSLADTKPAAPVVERKENEVVSLSPFEVSIDQDKGSPGAATHGGKLLAESSAAIAPMMTYDRGNGDDDKPRPLTAPKPVLPEFPEVSAAKEPVSTFSLHVSDVSFRLAQAALGRGMLPDRASVRAEEFYNAFGYGDPNPALADKVSCRIEQAAHPFLQQRNLVRVALKVAASGRDAAQPLRLTVLLDTSGSMEREDRVAIVQGALASLVSLLGPADRITVIGFARQPRLLAESVPGDQAGRVLDLVAHTPAEGGTNLEEALKLGHELARRQFAPMAQNRIVLLTDGAANLGNAQPAQLAAAIEALRQQHIAFDACGVGLEGLDDDMLETLTRKGDGRYYVLNSPEAADANFAQQLAGAFRPAAENVKLQVRFNPTRVGQYRLIGFEQHRLNEEDFRNDQVDAAELAAEESAVAVYQVEALPQGEGELGEIYVRFRDPASGNMVERSWPMTYDAHAPAFDRASPSMQLAGSAALFAEILRGGDAGGANDLSELVPVMNRLRNHYANEARVQQFVAMFEQARRLGAK